MKNKTPTKADLIPAGAWVLEPRSSYDQAIIGKTIHGGVIYSERKLIAAIMEDGCSFEEALDHYYYNIVGSIDNFGKKSPKIRKDLK